MVNENLHDLRKDYTKHSLDLDTADDNPHLQFKKWFKEISKDENLEPNAMILSTVSENKPSSRVVLLKEFSNDGFVFYTNYDSRKGQELSENRFASLLFFWPSFERQVRIEGEVEKVSEETSDSYFKKRPPESQISAIVSPQSKPVSKEYLQKKVNEIDKNSDLPRPKNWGGYRLKANYFEFWQGGENRLHDRITYNLNNNDWVKDRIAP